MDEKGPQLSSKRMPSRKTHTGVQNQRKALRTHPEACFSYRMG